MVVKEDVSADMVCEYILDELEDSGVPSSAISIINLVWIILVIKIPHNIIFGV